MTKIVALLPDQVAQEEVTRELSKLEVEDLDWEFISPDQDQDRILPVFGVPAHTSGNVAGGTGPVGVIASTDYPEDEALSQEGVDEEESEFLGRKVAEGAIAVVVEAPDKHDRQVQAILKEAGASHITVQ